MKGLTAYIYESKIGGNCSNEGISSNHKSVTIIGPGVPEIFEADESSPAVRIVRRNIGGEYIHAEPIERPQEIGWMDGGCFIYSHDSRFKKLSSYPIPLHDRQEYGGY